MGGGKKNYTLPDEILQYAPVERGAGRRRRVGRRADTRTVPSPPPGPTRERLFIHYSILFTLF